MGNLILVVDDEPDEAMAVRDLLVRQGFAVKHLLNGADALAAIDERPDDFDVVLSDNHMVGMSGMELCVELGARHPSIPVIILTGEHTTDVVVAALRAGAYDFVTKPLIVDAVIAGVKRAAEWRRQRADLLRLREAAEAARPIDGLIGESPAIRRVSELIRRVSQSDATVLITGESGTGKELVARAIHTAGLRADRPFAALNCGAVPEQLLESELFGHVKGAFTDARRDRAGLFIQAADGTVFLDEIGEMPLAMQVKLLRVLQERVVRPVGSDVDVPFVARVVCATNRDLETDVAEGRFREDLFYRVNVVQVEVPPLRERAGDVLMLAQHILHKIAARTGRKIAGFAPEAARKLLAYDWPGNVRELENTIERAVALTQHVEITIADLPSKVCDYKANHITIASDDASELMTLAELEGRYVKRVLATVGGNMSKAAKILGIDRRSLYRRLEEVPAA